ncbi:uncharacterized protein LOC127836239 [Dreissena polymorpha]|uniref:B box-type domain-containing protein n=1 Tax=Dreissena polymorpha TaxID=45954 RepID=A0A9D4JC26_DREPO|nr:uncharacterized protein LOC127836239 [Dreissena polymorpha]KAH3804154.1 hypothetical protein DPMN_132436 [Dreissena polymorpha]
MDSTEETTQSLGQESISDMTGECVVIKQCEACLQINISVEATLFCTSCTEFLCDGCKPGHIRYTRGKHDFENAKDSQIKSITVDLKGMDACEEHKKKVKFFCKDHSLLCCSTCAFSHRKCENINELVNISGDSGQELQNLKDKLANAAGYERSKIEDCKQTVIALYDKLFSFSDKLHKTKVEINKIFDETIERLNIEAKCTVGIEAKRLGERRSESETVLQSIVEVLPLCSDVIDNGTPQQAFILKRCLEKKVQEIGNHVKEQRVNHFSLDLSLDVSTELTNFLQKRSDAVNLIVKKCIQIKDETSGVSDDINSDQTSASIGSLINTDLHSSPELVQVNSSSDNSTSQSRPVTLKLLMSVELSKTGDHEKEPFLSGLDFLPDGRLVVVDMKNKKCMLLTERLQRQGTPYTFKSHPRCVVCLSPSEIAVTLNVNTICLLSINVNNVISLHKEITTSSNIFSICCKSPTNMVVSTCDEHRHARIISVDGVESDLDLVLFPLKTYKSDQSKCTYVQSKNTLVLTERFADTVYMYDTVKGTSRAVTDRNIQQPRGACVGPGDTVLVCSTANNSIVHLSVDVEVLGTYPVDMWYPYSICASEDGTRLAVSNSAAGAKKLQLYMISPAIS